MTSGARRRHRRHGGVDVAGRLRRRDSPVHVSRSAFHTVSASPSLSARATADLAAVEAYAGMMRAWVDAAKTADPESQSLRQYAQGEALKFLVNQLYGLKLQHKIALGEPGTSPTAIEARPADVPTAVLIRDC